MAAIRAAERGRNVLLLEKNARAGVKILMSGGTRCNITHACDNRGIIAEYGSQGRFLNSALAAFGVEDTLRFFNDAGVATKVESTGKVFPVSNQAADVLMALERRAQQSGVTLALAEPVQKIGVPSQAPQGRGTDQGPATHTLATTKRTILAEKLILTTGGQSYPGSGTTGEGYRWMAEWGHSIVEPRPALTPITLHDDWTKQLSGITIPDVALCVLDAGKPIAKRRGSFLFTHFGLSGPVVLDVSRAVSRHATPQSLVLECDFLPAISANAFAEELKQRSGTAGRKLLAAILPEALPARLHEALVARAEVRLDRKAAELTKHERAALVAAYKAQAIRIAGTRGFKQAEVTSGGVSLDEVDSRTMESKRVPSLYLAGEILDLDGPIGGYNFQAAWSTGWLAGNSV
jgi:predicted Rossmann fold flavoprotein